MKLGIDLGTTTCTVGNLLADGRRSVQSAIPSIGAWRNGSVVFGAKARELLRSEDHNVHPIRDLKLLLGKENTVRFGHTEVEVVELAADMLRHLVRRQSADPKVDSAVIATPVRVSLAHRSALREAAKRAGISDVQFVYEPSAALVGAQRFAAPEAHGVFLVVDWGGGTLDIAVIRSDGRKYEELAVGGDVDVLGGSQIDRLLAESLLNADESLRRAVYEVPGGVDRFRDEVEEMKLHILHSIDGPEGEVEEAAPVWLGNALIRLEPARVYQVLEEFTDQAVNRILHKLASANLKPDGIHNVLFAGGVCIAPEVSTRIMQEFPNARRITQVAGMELPLKPQELTGAGCTEITARNIVVELAANLGIRQSDDSVCVVLEKGLPVRLNTYREVEFLVTDPMATEAVLDAGIVRGDPGEHDLMGWKGGTFESLKQIFVPVGRSFMNQAEAVADWLKVCVGVDDNLAVVIAVETQVSMTTERRSVTGIPLVLVFQ